MDGVDNDVRDGMDVTETGGLSWQLDGFDDALLDEAEDDAVTVQDDSTLDLSSGEQPSDQPSETRQVINESESNVKKSKMLTLINTNARSLCPKVDSLLDCMGEMEADVGWSRRLCSRMGKGWRMMSGI